MDTDTLIVGAGPTGLMLANQLGRRGVRTLIIDRHSGPAQQTRAMAVHARTLEIYSKLGIADRALDAVWGELEQRFAGFDYGPIIRGGTVDAKHLCWERRRAGAS